jgi:hypothetical protein
MLRAMIGFLAADKDFTISDENRILPVKVSPPAIDRLLKPIKKKFLLKDKRAYRPRPAPQEPDTGQSLFQMGWAEAGVLRD